MLRGHPEAHVLTEHEPRLCVETRNRTKDNHGNGYQYPLERHDDVLEPGFVFRTFRNEGERNNRRHDETKHRNREQVADEYGKIV